MPHKYLQFVQYLIKFCHFHCTNYDSFYDLMKPTATSTRAHFQTLEISLRTHHKCVMHTHLFKGGRQQHKCVVIFLLWTYWHSPSKLLDLSINDFPPVVHVLLSSVRGCTERHASLWLTDGAVFTRPALVAVTLALSADSVVDAAWVTVPLLTFWSCPAFLALTHTTDAWSVGTTVHHAHLCRERKGHRDMTLLFCKKQIK